MRREFITLVGGAAVACRLPGAAQQPARMKRLCVLSPKTPTENRAFGAFLQRLERLDGRRGVNVYIEYRFRAIQLG